VIANDWSPIRQLISLCHIYRQIDQANVNLTRSIVYALSWAKSVVPVRPHVQIDIG
jgi:hypothetical protein